MTKLSNMDLPKSLARGGPGMFYCKICKEWVPSKEKHWRKRHKDRDGLSLKDLE